MRVTSLSQALTVPVYMHSISEKYMHIYMSFGHVAAHSYIECSAWMQFALLVWIKSYLLATVSSPKFPPFPHYLCWRMSGCWKMFPQSNVWWLWHASLQQLLQYFATFSPEMLPVEEGEGEVSASQQPLLCRIHAVKLWLFRREKQKATAPVLNIVSFLPVSFSFLSLSLLLCLVVLLLCLYSTLTPSLFACWWAVGSVRWGRRAPGMPPTAAGAHRFSTLKRWKRRRGSPKCLDFSWEKGEAAWESIREEWVVISKTFLWGHRFYTPAQLTCKVKR